MGMVAVLPDACVQKGHFGRSHVVGVVFVGLHIFLPDPEHAVGRLFLKRRADLGDSLLILLIASTFSEKSSMEVMYSCSSSIS